MFQLSIIDHIRLSFGSAVGAYQGHTAAALRLSQWGWYSKIATLSLLGLGAAANLLAVRQGYGVPGHGRGAGGNRLRGACGAHRVRSHAADLRPPRVCGTAVGAL